MSKTLAKSAFFVLTFLLLIFTSIQGFNFGVRLYNDRLMAAAVLLVLDIAAVIWLFTFLNYAEGTLQRSLAAVMFLVSLLSIGTTVAVETMLSNDLGQWQGESTFISGMSYAVPMMIFIHVAAGLVFKMVDPGNMAKMKMRNAQDKIIDRAHSVMEDQLQSQAEQLADVLGQGLIANALAELNLQDTRNSNRTAATLQQVEKERKTLPGATATARPAPVAAMAADTATAKRTLAPIDCK